MHWNLLHFRIITLLDPTKFFFFTCSLQGPKHKVEMNGSFSSMERSVGISEHLKIVEVKCEVIDERVLKVLQFLCTFSIRKLTYISSRASIFLILF